MNALANSITRHALLVSVCLLAGVSLVAADGPGKPDPVREALQKSSGLSIDTEVADRHRSPWEKRVSAGTSIFCIPAAVHAAGSAGTNWRTDIEVYNPGSEVTVYTIELLLRDTDNSTPQSMSFTLAPGTAQRFQDLIDSVFQISGAGALRITASTGSLLLTSRTYNDQAEGTYGQFVPSFFDHEAIAYGEEARLIHLSQSSDFRTNLGLINASPSSSLVDISLYDAAGNHLGELAFSWLRPYELKQLDKVFQQVTATPVEDGYAIITPSINSRLFAYASVVDNGTGDPVFIPAKRTIPFANLMIPAAAHAAGSAGTNWRTDVEVHNAGKVAASYTFSLLEAGVNNADPVTQTFSLDPGRAIRYTDVLDSMFAYQGSAALAVEVDSGNLMVNSRTYNAQPDGTYGQFVAAEPDINAIAFGETGRLMQLSHDFSTTTGFRTNIGFVNATGKWLQLELELYDADGNLLGTVPSGKTSLRPYSYRQVDRVYNHVTSSSVKDGYALIRAVTNGGHFYAYASVVDNRTGDPIYVPVQRAPTGVTVTKQLEETSYYLRDVELLSTTVGWAVGDPHWNDEVKDYVSTIVKTTDGGLTWQPRQVDVTEIFRAVSFVDADTGWAVGTNGAILHTSDGGDTWVRQSIATNDELRDLFFLDADNGWVVGIETTHIDDFTGWADNWQGSVWHTSDGGQTWSEQSVPANASILNGITFVDESNGWVVGIRCTDPSEWMPEHRATIYYTSDGGQTWSEQLASDKQIVFTEVDFVDASRGWAVGFKSSSGEEGGTIYHTSDGGETWIQDEPSYSLWDVQFIDADHGYAVGQMYGAAWGPPVLRTTDGGATWDLLLQDRHDGEGLYGVAVRNDRILAVGDHDLVCSTDNPWGGSDPPNYASLFDQKYVNTHLKLEDVYFVDESYGWAVGRRTYEDPSIWGQVIFNTTDGGETWQMQYHQQPPESLFTYFRLDAVQFLDRATGWAVGTFWTYYGNGWEEHYGIMHTDNGGQDWVEQGLELTDGVRPEMVDLHFLDDQHGWLLDKGHEGKIFLARTDDGGASWSWVPTNIDGNMTIGFEVVMGGVFFTDEQNGWAVGGLGEVVHTGDGGATWQRQQLGCGFEVCYENLQDVVFRSPDVGFIAAESGPYRTIDGGDTWIQQELDMSGMVNGLDLADGRNMWLIGWYGQLLRSQDGGATWVPIETGTGFELLGMHFVEPETGWLVGNAGVILKVERVETP
jgi:photosystem II stability/assembly factor-like uncharacterized protein